MDAGMRKAGGTPLAAIAAARRASDLVIWNNTFRNVWLGLSWDTLSSGVVGRLVAADNLIVLAATRVTSPNTDRTGVLLEGAAANSYQQVILRRNQVCDVQDPAARRSCAASS